MASRFIFALALIWTTFPAVAIGADGTVPPVRPLDDQSRWRQIDFRNLPPTDYQFGDGVLRASVSKSTSFLLYPFGRALPVRTVEWEWAASGGPRLASASHEQSKAGDDAQLRIGLLMQGAEPRSFFFRLPAWIRQVRHDLQPQTTNAMLFLISGGQHEDGERWPSPYAAGITHQAVAGKPGPNKWQRSTVTFDDTAYVVGLWLMADGDDTDSDFETRLRNLVLHLQ